MPERKRPRLRLVTSVSCPTCEAGPGDRCTLTLAPELAPLSIDWAHRAREAAAS